MTETQIDMPERIYLDANGDWTPDKFNTSTEYIRADLPSPREAKLLEALRESRNFVYAHYCKTGGAGEGTLNRIDKIIAEHGEG